jgi:hypothetical protein
MLGLHQSVVVRLVVFSVGQCEISGKCLGIVVA